MNQVTKIAVATTLSLGTLLGATAGASAIHADAHAATEQQTPYYTYNGLFNFKGNKALEDKNFYRALQHDNFKYEGLKVGQSTFADVKKAVGNDVKKYYEEKGVTYYEKNDVIFGIDSEGKLVNMTLLIEKINHSDKYVRDHVKQGEIYDTKTTHVAFYSGNSIVIKAKESR
ncbi:hypothetical protein B5C02_09900 [Staphylococcus pseudintermedius]|uniref:immunodominant staphylococcal antigen IsaB family protein n=1 Tax=Staphylococcus pseudintermedius TaxID=283734 RepID=UPI000BBB830E|nr:hypothetical protein [Staphylococcus pseudintermedius]PCF66012.1 hypothetical protein B5C02_09900 [Staphylococcus pseudintermedius]